MGAVPILVYHSITDHPSKDTAPLAVTPDEFTRHLDFLSEHGLRGVSVTEALESLRDAERSGHTSAVVGMSFDDGYANFADIAHPRLRARGMSSTLYVTTKWLGLSAAASGPREPMLTWSQLGELARDAVEIGAHTHTHPELDTAGNSRLREELDRPKRLLEDALGFPIRTLAYPHGYNSARVRREAARAGYTSAVSVHDRAHHSGEHPYDISRFMPTAQTTATDLERWVLRAGDHLRHRESLLTKGWRGCRIADSLLHRRVRTRYS